MAKIVLTPQTVKSATCLPGKPKVDLFDTETKGLMLEVRETGKKTYYFRYQNARGVTRQLRLADASDISLSQARALVAKHRTKLALGEDPCDMKKAVKQVPTVSEFIRQQYIPYVKGYKRSWATDEGLLRNHVEPVWGKRYMDEIQKQDVVTLMMSHRETHAPGSCNRLLILLRYLFNLAVRWETAGIKKNPTAGFPKMEENNKHERYLSKEEGAILYEELMKSDNQMLRYIIPMLILTGARKREVLDAKWVDIDFERRVWRIPTTKSGRPRHVPISEGAMRILKSVPRYADCPWIFPNPKTKKPFVSIFASWKTARTNAGLPEVRIHDLRHSFASFLVNAGRSLYEVQKILGHAEIKTTQRYAHLRQETLLDAANAAVDALGVEFMPPMLAAALEANTPPL